VTGRTTVPIVLGRVGVNPMKRAVVKMPWDRSWGLVSTKSSIHRWSPASACPEGGRSRSAFFFLRADAVFVAPFARLLRLRRSQRKFLWRVWIECCISMSNTAFTLSFCSTRISATFHRMQMPSSSYWRATESAGSCSRVWTCSFGTSMTGGGAAWKARYSASRVFTRTS